MDDYNVPGTLQHRPVICLNQYNTIDGKYGADTTDAKGLSLGLAQWNDNAQKDLSAKVWRHSGEKWSRQSEELPLHRVLDLALMIIKSLEKVPESSCFTLKESNIDFGMKKLKLKKCGTNPEVDGDMKCFNCVLRNESGIIHERLEILSAALKELGY